MPPITYNWHEKKQFGVSMGYSIVACLAVTMPSGGLALGTGIEACVETFIMVIILFPLHCVGRSVAAN